jgi:hypothetical protein
VEHDEAVKHRLLLEQLRDGGGNVWQLGAGVADIQLAWIQNRANQMARSLRLCIPNYQKLTQITAFSSRIS